MSVLLDVYGASRHRVYGIETPQPAPPPDALWQKIGKDGQPTNDFMYRKEKLTVTCHLLRV
jgi:hypothetical protein